MKDKGFEELAKFLQEQIAKLKKILDEQPAHE